MITAIRKLWESDADANPALRVVLIPLAKLYAAWMRIRADLYRKGLCRTRKLPCRVISVGNLSAGGTGKTPMVMYLARYLTAKGLKVVVISRGYRGRLEKQGGIVSDGQKVLVGVADSGDEPQILATQLAGVPVIVGGNRYRAGQRAVRAYAPDVILLDDAFQHLKLHRDLDLVLMDWRRPFGNGYTLPAGELREPPHSLNRTDAVIFTRCDVISGTSKTKKTCADLTECFKGPVFKTRHIPIIRNIVPGRSTRHMQGSIAGRRVFAFSGVAKNEDFLYTLSDFECDIVGSLGFPDHHHYSSADLAGICRRAENLAVDVIVTTEKDYVKIRRTAGWPVDLVVMGIDISFGGDRERFQAFLVEKGILT
jgi:tetraacyldisaccharide 4'-kinase